MAFGLQVRDSGGSVVLDTADRLTKLHSVINVGNSSTPLFTEYFQSVTGMATNGEWAAVTDNFAVYSRIAADGFYWMFIDPDRSDSPPVVILKV